MRRVLAALIVSLAALGRPVAHAQTASGGVTYHAGWNMVAAGVVRTLPDFAPAGPLLFYINGQYQPMNVPALLSGTAGAWAYLPANETVTILAPAYTYVVTAPLAPGWNLVGDPYDVPATLPPSTTAYWWDAQAGTYQPVTAIPTGRSVWIYAASAGQMPLHVEIPGA